MCNNLKLLVFTDLHSEIIDNPEERVDAIINAAKSNYVDLIINIGDFGYHSDTSKTLCEEKNQPVNYNIFFKQRTDKYMLKTKNLLKKFDDLDIPVLHTLGNHDMDFNSKETAVNDYGMKNNYYYYDINNFRIIVLDTNYYLDDDGIEVSYSFGNNFNQNKKAVLSYEQTLWLDESLQTDKKIIVCSHNVLTDDPRGVENYKDVYSVLNKRGEKILALSGHKHIDKLTIDGNLSFLEVNSASYYWLGEKSKMETSYSDKYLEDHPVLPYILRYPEPLYAIISLNNENIKVKGRGESLNLSDNDRQILNSSNISSKIKDYKF